MNKKKILIIAGAVLPVLIIVAVLALATQFFSKPLALSISIGAPAAATEPAAQVAQAPVTLPTPSAGKGILIDMGSKVVNLADPGGYRYVKVGLVLEFLPKDPAYFTLKTEEKTKEETRIRTEITDLNAIINDAVISCISDKAFGDIFNMAGKDSLKSELAKTINERLDDVEVVRVYFTDFVIN